MVSNNAANNNSSCGPTVLASTIDDSLVHLLFGNAASSSFSSPQQPLFARPSNRFTSQNLSDILGEALSIVQDDDFSPTNDANDFFTMSSPLHDEGYHGAPKQ